MSYNVSHSPVEVIFIIKSLLQTTQLIAELIFQPTTSRVEISHEVVETILKALSNPNLYSTNVIVEAITNIPPPPAPESITHYPIEIMYQKQIPRLEQTHFVLEAICNVPEEAPTLSRGRLGPRIQSM